MANSFAMQFDSQYLLPYIIVNIVSLVFVWAAIKKPYLARLLFVLLFGWACWINYTMAHERPQEYLNYSKASIQWYADFINGWFASHITQMVSLIAIGQGLIAIGMLLKGVWVKAACIGVIIFLTAITPLGFYAGFPFTLTVSIAAWFVLKSPDLDYLWKFRPKKSEFESKQQHA
jgi:hypothetical protein